jgi:hypothetical protein
MRRVSTTCSCWSWKTSPAATAAATMAGMACPLGAHYLPLPGAPAHEVVEWLHEMGLLRSELAAPWPTSATCATARRSGCSRRRLARRPAATGRPGLGDAGAVPALCAARRWWPPAPRLRAARATAAPWTAANAALDGADLRRLAGPQGLDDAALRWYLDYCCRDDYGAGAGHRVGLGRAALLRQPPRLPRPGRRPSADGERDAGVHLARRQRLAGAAPGRAAARSACTPAARCCACDEQRHGVQVLAWDDGDQAARPGPPAPWCWRCRCSSPLASCWTRRLRPAAGRGRLPHAPWLVANLQLDKPLVDRPGAPPAWDNVVYGQRGLGYVDAMHQSLRPHAGPTVLTAYHALPVANAPPCCDRPWTAWAEHVLDDPQPVHPDLRRAPAAHRPRCATATRWPCRCRGRGQLTRARAALRGGHGRIRFAHADLAGYSVFEEAFTAGCEAAAAPCRCA